jgi:hypothetical protein
MNAPRTIFIIGIAGSGKTTLAERLARQLGAPHIDLDRIRHPRSGDDVPAAGAVDQVVDRLVYQPDWVADGVPSAWITPLLAAADRIIWLDTSAARSTYHIIRRHMVGKLTPGKWPFATASTVRLAHGALTAGRREGRRLGRPAAEVPWRREVELAIQPFSAKVVHITSIRQAQQLTLGQDHD